MMTDSDSNKSQENQSFSEETLNQALGLLTKTSEILGIKPDTDEISLDSFRNIPEEVQKIKDAGNQAVNNHAKFKIFVAEALKENIKYLDDAYILAGHELAEVEVTKESAKHIKKIVENLKVQRPYLFQNEQISDMNLPVDFISSGENASVLESLRDKAMKSGSPQDLQKYWSVRKQVR